MTTTTPLNDELESILHLNGCQQYTAGYNAAKKGEELNLEEIDHLEKLTLKEVQSLTQALLTHFADIYGLPIKEVLKNAKLFKEKL